MNRRMNTWSKSTLIEWVNTLSTINSGQKTKIINGINSFGATGEDLFDADKDDLADCLEIGGMLARKLYIAIGKQKEKEFKNKIGGNININNNNNNNNSFSVIIMGKGGKYGNLKNIKSTYTIKQLKEIYFDQEIGYGSQNFEFIYRGKELSDNVTLKDCGIMSGAKIFAVFKVMGGGGNDDDDNIFEEYNNEWKVMYERCPVCIYKNIDKNKLAKGYWYHTSGDKSEFKSTKPGGCAVEIKMNKIRCPNIGERDAKNWQFKCSNHDYEKIKL